MWLVDAEVGGYGAVFALVGEELVGFVWGGADGGAVGTGGYWSVGGALVFVLFCMFLAVLGCRLLP